MIKHTDPVTSDRVYDKHEAEFLRAAIKFRAEKNRVPTLSDTFHILLELGYEKPCGFQFTTATKRAASPPFLKGILPAASTYHRFATSA